MKSALKYTATHFIEIAIAWILLWQDIRYFLLFWFIYTLYARFTLYNHLRQLARVFNVSTETKIGAILKKLKIGDDEIAQMLEAQRKLFGEDNWKSLEKDFASVMNRR